MLVHVSFRLARHLYPTLRRLIVVLVVLGIIKVSISSSGRMSDRSYYIIHCEYRMWDVVKLVACHMGPNGVS